MAIKLKEALQQLDAVGEDGFEGLICGLLAHVTRQPFHLSASGDQRGQDGRSADSRIAVECKRYQGKVKKNDVIGEFSRSRLDRPSDIWVLAATTRVQDQLKQELEKLAAREGVSCLVLDWQNAGQLPLLKALCALNDDAIAFVLGFLERVGSRFDRNGIKAELQSVRDHAQFADTATYILRNLNAAEVSYQTARQHLTGWLRDALADPGNARARLHQDAGLYASGAGLIRRETALQECSNWWAIDPQVRKPLVILGGEGVGKSWAALHWLKSTADLPLTIVINARDVGEGDTDVCDLMARILARRIPTADQTGWWLRLKRWAENGSPVLLVLDGLNEHRKAPWLRLFASAEDEAWRGCLAILATCRKSYFNDLVGPHERAPSSFILGDYDPDERRQAIEAQGRQIEDVPPSLLGHASNPRLLRIILALKEKSAIAGDPTLYRLIMEEWRDRISSKQRPLMGEKDFQEFLRENAEAFRQKVKRGDLRRSVSEFSPDALDDILAELTDSGHLFPNGTRLDPRLAPLALGLMLAGQVGECPACSGPDETIATFTEQFGGMDELARILGSAATVALYGQEYPQESRQALLRAWLDAQNFSDEDEREFLGLLPANPAAYLDLAGERWLGGLPDERTRGLFLSAFIKWAGSTNLQQEAVPRVQRWLAVIEKPDDRPAPRFQRDAAAMKGGPFTLLGCKFEIESSPDFRGQLAFALMSLMPRTPFLPALRVWALACAAQGYVPDLRRSQNLMYHNMFDPAAASEQLKAMADDLLTEGSSPARIAATWLLCTIPTPDAHACARALLSEQGADERDPRGVRLRQEPEALATSLATDATDPAYRLPDHVVERLPAALRAVVGEVAAHRDWTAADHTLASITPALARWAPAPLAEFWRNKLRDMGRRSSDAAAHLGRHLNENLLIIDRDTRFELLQVWLDLHRKSNRNGNLDNDLTCAMLWGRPALQQLEVLSQRAPDAPMWGDITTVLSPLSTEDAERLLLKPPPEAVARPAIVPLLLSCMPATALSDAAWRALLDRLRHEDPSARALAFQACLSLGCPDAKEVLAAAESYQPMFTDVWRALCVVRFGTHLDYDALKRLAPLSSVAFALTERGAGAEDYARLAVDVEAKLQNSLPLDSLLGFGHRWTSAPLEQALRLNPNLAGQWRNAVVECIDKQGMVAEPLIPALTAALFAQSPSDGLAVWEKLRQRAALEAATLDYLLFDAPDLPDIEAARRRRVQSCVTDAALMCLAMAATHAGKESFLHARINEDWSGELPCRRARALTLAGMLGSAELHSVLGFEDGGWLGAVAEAARHRHRRNQCARHWFGRFLHDRDDTEAWAAFRLFLASLDQRSAYLFSPGI